MARTPSSKLINSFPWLHNCWRVFCNCLLFGTKEPNRTVLIFINSAVYHIKIHFAYLDSRRVESCMQKLTQKKAVTPRLFSAFARKCWSKPTRLECFQSYWIRSNLQIHTKNWRDKLLKPNKDLPKSSKKSCHFPWFLLGIARLSAFFRKSGNPERHGHQDGADELIRDSVQWKRIS